MQNIATDPAGAILLRHAGCLLVSTVVEGVSDGRDRDVLLIRPGTNEHPHTLPEMAVKWGISRERVRQIQNRAFRRLAAWSRDESTPGAALRKFFNAVCDSSYETARASLREKTMTPGWL